MKIITNTKINGELCYVQVKDILFLARITKNANVMQQYITLINSGHTDNEFVRITQKSYIKAIKNCDYIVDFVEFGDSKLQTSYLSSLIVTLNFSVINEFDKECVEHKTDGLRDIMSFKRGDLEYKIPLIPNGVIEKCNEDENLVFSSTVIDNCFIIKSVDGTAVQNIDYFDFYLDCLDIIYNEFYPNIPFEERKHDVIDRGGVIIIQIYDIKKKKENIVNRVLSKLKKGSK